MIASGQVDPTEHPYIDLPHIAPDNIQSGTGRISEIQTARELGITSGKYLFDKEAIVYSKIRPNLNKVCIPGFTGTCSADMYPIWTQDGLDTVFLFQYMLADQFLHEATKVSARTGLPKINRPDLQRIMIPLPPLAEQRAIAAILSTWDEAISLTERLIAALQQRKRGLMQRLLTGEVRFPEFEGEEWQEVGLQDIAQIIMGQSPNSEAYNEHEDGLPLIQGNADIQNRRTAPKVFTRELTKLCEIGDTILSVRAPVGETAIAVHNACIGRGVCAIRATKSDPHFLFQLLISVEEKWQRYAQGSTFTAINSTDIRNFALSLPESSHEQRAISEVLGLADTEIESCTLLARKLREQKKGLMQRLLTGEIRVQVSDA